ncbi:MAG: M48 family metalloprotease [Clostridia bacterium]|nr:M48 family metalloprotease [Clostridia bacterium]
MNIIMFILNLLKPKNWLIILSIVLNVGICAGIAVYVSYLFGYNNYLLVSICVIAAYIALELFMLTPVGEAIMRRKMKMKPMPETHWTYAVFNEVKRRTRIKNRWLSKRLKLYYTESKEMNAYALGSRTVCITSALTYLKPDYIEGILAHEFGHITYYDSYVSLLARHGNMLFYAVVMAVWALCSLFALFLDVIASSVCRDTRLFRLMVMHFANLLISVVSLISSLLFCARSRIAEYGADAFAVKIDEGENLRDGLITITGGSSPRSRNLTDMLMNTHPATEKRVKRINKLIAA